MVVKKRSAATVGQLWSGPKIQETAAIIINRTSLYITGITVHICLIVNKMKYNYPLPKEIKNGMIAERLTTLSYELARPLKEAIAKLNSLQKEYPSHVNLRLEWEEQDYGDGYILELYGDRKATLKEIEARERYDKEWKEEQEKRDKEAFERLKKKYEK